MRYSALSIVIALMAAQSLQITVVCPQEMNAGYSYQLYILAYNPFNENASIEMLEVSTPNRTNLWIVEGKVRGVVEAGAQAGVAQYAIIVSKDAPSGVYLINVLIEYKLGGQVQWYQQSLKVKITGYYGDTSLLIMRAESLLYNLSLRLSSLEDARDSLRKTGANTSSVDLMISRIKENITSAGELISSSKKELNRENYGEASYLAEKAISIINSTLKSTYTVENEIKILYSSRAAEMRKKAEDSILAARSRIYNLWNEVDKLKKSLNVSDELVSGMLRELWGIMPNITKTMEMANNAYSNGNYSLSIELSSEVASMAERAEKLINSIYDRISFLRIKERVEDQINRTESVISYCRESLKSIYPTISWNKTAVSMADEINRTLDEIEAELSRAKSLIGSGDYYSASFIVSNLSSKISSVLGSLDHLRKIERTKLEVESPSSWRYAVAGLALTAFLAMIAFLLRIRR
ncbi:MAG: hypothetical protein ACP5JF_06100 [Candidatus Methanodesulfokora sp.]